MQVSLSNKLEPHSLMVAMRTDRSARERGHSGDGGCQFFSNTQTWASVPAVPAYGKLTGNVNDA